MKAETNEWQLIQAGQLPKVGNFYHFSLEHHGIPGPPLPNSLCSTCNIYGRGDGVFAVEDVSLVDPTENLDRLTSFS
jgi:hypothetical protein